MFRINFINPWKIWVKLEIIGLQANFIDSWLESCKISLRWMLTDLTDDKSTLVQAQGNVYQDPCHHMPSLSHNEFMAILYAGTRQKMLKLQHLFHKWEIYFCYYTMLWVHDFVISYALALFHSNHKVTNIIDNSIHIIFIELRGPH